MSCYFHFSPNVQALVWQETVERREKREKTKQIVDNIFRFLLLYLSFHIRSQTNKQTNKQNHRCKHGACCQPTSCCCLVENEVSKIFKKFSKNSFFRWFKRLTLSARYLLTCTFNKKGGRVRER